MEIKASVRYARIGDLKARQAADAVRGFQALTALNLLLSSRRKAGRIIAKVLKNALARAEAEKVIDPENLYIGVIQVDKGPLLKRFRPGARGASFPYKRRQSHITVELKEK